LSIFKSISLLPYRTVEAWFTNNELLLNADKSDVMFIGTSAGTANNVTNIVVARANRQPTDELKSLGFILASRLTFAAYALAVLGACNYYKWELRHILHLLTLVLHG